MASTLVSPSSVPIESLVDYLTEKVKQWLLNETFGLVLGPDGHFKIAVGSDVHTSSDLPGPCASSPSPEAPPQSSPPRGSSDHEFEHNKDHPLTFPGIAVDTPASCLYFMSEDQKDLLKSRAKPEHIAQMDSEQLASVNMLNIVVPHLGDDRAGKSVWNSAHYVQDGKSCLHLAVASDCWWYCVVRGYCFTGVICGGARATKHTLNIASAFMTRHSLRAKAELAWLKAYYERSTCILLYRNAKEKADAEEKDRLQALVENNVSYKSSDKDNMEEVLGVCY